METTDQQKGQKGLQTQVIQNGLCAGCGACVHLCPYFEHYRDHTVILHECDGIEGRCFSYCPRTLTDLSALQEELYAVPQEVIPELGAVKGLYMTRAADEAIRQSAQHGGTVTALVALAFETGMIDTAVLAGQKDNLLAYGATVSGASEVSTLGKSKFVVSPTVGKFNEVAKGAGEKIGVVATPCQALALAKMRCGPAPEDAPKMAKLKLVIGLFCGWALSWEKLKTLLDNRFGDTPILKLDIPPSRHQCMEVTTASGIVSLPLKSVEHCMRENCRYCFDMTCEFSDISVGSARSAEGWGVDKGWNQVIVRTETGRMLFDLARQRGILEFKDVPKGNLEKLKAASLNKKRNCINNLVEKSGDTEDLIYLISDDPVVKKARGR